MTVTLYPHQRQAAWEAARQLQTTGGFYLEHDPGMGKTLTAITVARVLGVRSIVIVCPVIAIGVWAQEFNKWWPDCPADVYCTNYERLVGKRHQADLQELIDLKPDLLILDEAQYVKSPSAQRTRVVARLAQDCTYKLLLSGTPAHSPVDYWSQYRILAPKESIFSGKFDTFRKSLLVMGGPNGTWPKKDKYGRLQVHAGKMSQLLRIMQPYVHRARMSELNVPEPILTPITVTLSPQETKHYKEMEKKLRTELPPGTEANAEIVLTKVLRLAQIAAGHVTDETGQTVRIGTTKLDAAYDLCQQREQQKIVIAARFRADLASLHDCLDMLPVPRTIMQIDGDTPEQGRTTQVQAFQEMQGAPVMLLQYQAGGVSVTLTGASALVLFTLDPSVIRYRQMLGRVWRIGQPAAVQVLPILAEGTVDELLWSGLQNGLDAVDMARLVMRYLHG